MFTSLKRKFNELFCPKEIISDSEQNKKYIRELINYFNKTIIIIESQQYPGYYLYPFNPLSSKLMEYRAWFKEIGMNQIEDEMSIKWILHSIND